MHRGLKVKIVTPAGRREYLEILEPYVLRDRGLADEWIIWVNTPHLSDVKYIESIRDRNPGFVRLVYSSTPLVKGKPRPQSPFFRGTIDPDTVYVKYDDDICWVAADALTRLVDSRLDNPEPLFVMANTVMNGYCAYLHCKYGAQGFLIDGTYQRIPPEFGNKVWSEVRYAEYVHRTFLADLAAADIGKYLFESWSLPHYERVAINCIAWMGSDFSSFGGVIPHVDEELWLSCIKPRELSRPNMICGSSLVAHHAFYKHRPPHVVGNPIDLRILRAYKAISAGTGPEIAIRAMNSRIML